MSPGRVLVAGCGDVGARLAQRLHAVGTPVAALNRSGRAVPAGVRWLCGDLTDAASMQALGAEPPFSALVHLPSPAQRTEAAYRAVFVDGLARLLDAMPVPPARLVYVSSTAVYGEDDGSWVDERTPPRPAGFNGRILLEGEALARQRIAGTLVLRLVGLYGPGRMRMRVPGPRPDHGAAPRWGNRLHVEDAASALAHVLALAAPEPCYVVADDQPLRDDLLQRWLRDGSPHEPAQRQPDVPVPGPASGRRVSNARLRASGWAPRFPDARAVLASALGQMDMAQVRPLL